MSDWPERSLWFDVEATGIDVVNDRIVQLFIGIADHEGNIVEEYEWLIDPGVEVPEEAANIHGFTTDYLQKNGIRPDLALIRARNVFENYAFIPWGAFNLNYDLSIIHHEMRRHLVSRGFGGYGQGGELLDGLVIDRARDKYRKGKRRLEFMAEHYGIPFDANEAHNAKYDVEVTAKVTRAIIEKHGSMDNGEQATAYADWAKGLQDYLRRSDPGAIVDPNWPLKLKGD